MNPTIMLLMLYKQLVPLAYKNKLMKYGILINEVSHQLFEEINERTYCKDCQKKRSIFSSKDKKDNDCYSNLLPGFSSKKTSIPIDILIVAEAHGGGREDNFRPQKELKIEIDGLGAYYLESPLQKFHQSEMRKLLNILNENDKNWVFTDLIKCFVWKGRDKSKKLKSSKNKETAIEYCQKYLDKQIHTLRPKKVLSLGSIVTKKYFNLKGRICHGSVHTLSIKDHSFKLVYSIFPSMFTADKWIENGEWKDIITKLI